MKKIIILLLCTLVIISTGCACSKKEKEPVEEEKVVEITDKTLTDEQIVDGIRFKNVSFVVKGGKTEFRVTLENTVTTVKKISHLEIQFLDQTGRTIKTVNHYDFEHLKKGDTKNLSYTFSIDLSNVKKIVYQYEE